MNSPQQVYFFLFVFFISCSSYAQRRYTTVHAAYSLEAFGASQGIQLALETPFRYRKSSFLTAQAGLGLYEQSTSVSTARNAFSLGSALTHCQLLNRSKGNCDPRPEFHQWEYYLESGLSGSFFPDRYKLPYAENSTLAAAQLLAGIRIQRIGKNYVHLLKLRFSPFLAPGFPLWGGVAYGIGLW